jgi:hypothetical protein
MAAKTLLISSGADDATARCVSSVHPAPLASMVAINAYAGRLTIKVKLHLTSRCWGSTNHGSAHKNKGL